MDFIKFSNSKYTLLGTTGMAKQLFLDVDKYNFNFDN